MEQRKISFLLTRYHMELPATRHWLQSLHTEVEEVLELVSGEGSRVEALSWTCPGGSPLAHGQELISGVAVTAVTPPGRQRPGTEVSVVNDIRLK